ncbi:hypothetical protein CC1G_11415 [Coprinopsis cinerea okayama7|uniref:Uncharacterized protein n=1 Tax=Coprinopsis cinerea (strain Okayama-7 / 130 / ATCC MYA-4618 / FGSC 9003) TaxID=240176 RepID=A8N484_COPC7|nr:hypothetical protein CC1G_11415 [Coprinopsis cinerea okayama7\|eukprot:XP_001829679.2 hypothetical protein CC1G_11415 [Coprinopsis cinerea okayama7\
MANASNAKDSPVPSIFSSTRHRFGMTTKQRNDVATRMSTILSSPSLSGSQRWSELAERYDREIKELQEECQTAEMKRVETARQVLQSIEEERAKVDETFRKLKAEAVSAKTKLGAKKAEMEEKKREMEENERVEREQLVREREELEKQEAERRERQRREREEKEMKEKERMKRVQRELDEAKRAEEKARLWVSGDWRMPSETQGRRFKD